ncbi:MAG: Na+/H+ antiporter subunit E [Rhodoferax sp.]
MKRWLPHPLLTPVLALIWLLLNNSASVGQLVLGLLLGWAIPLFTLAFWPERVRLRRPFSMLRFLRFFLYDVLVANLTVARLVLVGPRALNPVFVQVPLDLRNELAISLLANTTCLTPGTLSARLSEDRRFLLVHALDCTDPQALIDTIKTRFEAPLKEIFEC